MNAANEIKPVIPSPTGELTLGQQAEAARYLATPEGQAELARVTMPELSAWKWERDALESRHQLEAVNEQCAQTDRDLDELLASMGLTLS